MPSPSAILTSPETPPAPRRTQAERRADSENRLLAAGAEIIASEGYLAATLERVGERAGFSRGLASRKYGSKDGLIEAVIWRVSAHVHEQVDAAIAGVADPLERLLVLSDRFVELVLTDTSVRAYFVLFSAMLANRLETRDVFDQVQQRFGEKLEAIIAEAQAAGTITPGYAAPHAAFVVGSLLAGVAIEVVMGFGRVDDITEIRPTMAAMLRHALTGPQPA